MSWDARVDDSSPSSRLSITSRGKEDRSVVIAFNLGIVTVGDVAWAVKGMRPSRINLAPYYHNDSLADEISQASKCRGHQGTVACDRRPAEPRRGQVLQ